MQTAFLNFFLIASQYELTHLASMSESTVILWEIFLHFLLVSNIFTLDPKNFGRDHGMRFDVLAK